MKILFPTRWPGSRRVTLDDVTRKLKFRKFRRIPLCHSSLIPWSILAKKSAKRIDFEKTYGDSCDMTSSWRHQLFIHLFSAMDITDQKSALHTPSPEAKLHSESTLFQYLWRIWIAFFLLVLRFFFLPINTIHIYVIVR